MAMVVVVDDFDSGFMDFGCGGGMMFDFFFFCGFDGCGGGDGGCCGYGLVVRCLNFFFLWVWWLWWWRWWLLWLWFGGTVFDFFFLWVWWLWWWIGDYDGGLIFYFVCGFGCVWWWW